MESIGILLIAIVLLGEVIMGAGTAVFWTLDGGFTTSTTSECLRTMTPVTTYKGKDEYTTIKSSDYDFNHHYSVLTRFYLQPSSMSCLCHREGSKITCSACQTLSSARSYRVTGSNRTGGPTATGLISGYCPVDPGVSSGF